MLLLAAIAIPLGLDLHLPAPEGNLLTAEKIELGRRFRLPVIEVTDSSFRRRAMPKSWWLRFDRERGVRQLLTNSSKRSRH